MPVRCCCISANKHGMVLNAGTSQYSNSVSSDLTTGYMACRALNASLLRTWCQAGVNGWDVHTSQQRVLHLVIL